MNIGEKIKHCRESSGISQRELGRIIKKTGQFISLIENGNSNPSFDTLNKIAEALNVSVSELISDDHTIDISQMPSDNLNFLYDTELVELAEIFKSLGYELKENNLIIDILKDGKGIASIPEDDFISLGKESLKHINEYSEFQIKKLLDAYEFLSTR